LIIFITGGSYYRGEASGNCRGHGSVLSRLSCARLRALHFCARLISDVGCNNLHREFRRSNLESMFFFFSSALFQEPVCLRLIRCAKKWKPIAGKDNAGLLPISSHPLFTSKPGNSFYILCHAALSS